MAKFLNTSATNYFLEEMIKEAHDRLILISPFLKLNDRMKELLADKNRLLIRPDLSVIHAAYFTRASWKNFLTRSGDFSNACMCSVAAVFSLALVRTGTLV